jgi:LysR family pca operon transcriptional activator
VVETVSDSFGRAFVERYDAIWIISRGVVESEIAAGRFTTLDVDTTETRGAVGLTTRAGEPPNLALSIMMATLRERVGQLRRGL